jgi:hypothetical protein
LRNRAVLGEWVPHRLLNGKRVPVGEPVPDYYPAVVSQSAFNAARASVEAKNRNKGRIGGNRGGGRANVNSLFSPLVYDVDNRVPMVFHRKRGEPPYLVSKYQPNIKGHRFRLDTFEELFLNFLEDLDWQAIAGESEPSEVKEAQTELDRTLADLDRCERKILHLETLTAEDTPPISLYRDLDVEIARRDDLASRKEKLGGALAEARAKAAALRSPEELLALLASGNDPERRLRLKAEIKARISRIDVSFDEWEIDPSEVEFEDGEEIGPDERLDYCAHVYFKNGSLRAIGVKDGQGLPLEVTHDGDRIWQ